MSKKTISTTKAPAAIGPYSQGIELGNLVFTSGQLPLNPANGELINDNIANAAKQSLENLKAILEEAGSSLDKVIKTTVFLKSLDDFAEMNAVYSQYFTGEAPARSCFQVGKLPMDALVEIEAIASK